MSIGTNGSFENFFFCHIPIFVGGEELTFLGLCLPPFCKCTCLQGLSEALQETDDQLHMGNLQRGYLMNSFQRCRQMKKNVKE